MVVGLATGLMGLGLALPTGLAFGYGYGYGVRQGYSAFKPPSPGVNSLKQSPDPVKGALGAGFQSAEERTGIPLREIPSMKETSEKAINATATPPKPTHFAPTIEDKLKGIKDRDTYYSEKRRLEDLQRRKMINYKQSRNNKRF